MPLPAPIRYDHVGIGVPAMNTLFDHCDNLTDDVRVAALLAAGTGTPPAERSAAGQILRRCDRVHTTQARHLPKHMRQCISHPLPYRRMRSAKSPILALRIENTPHFGASLEECSWHRAWFIHVEVHANPVLPGSLDQSPEIGQPTRVVGSEFRKG